jgi:RNA polymerase sigma factor (TIGR02999 family)
VAACDDLFALLYDDLCRMAAGLLRHERHGHPLSPDDLVHETYFRVVDQTRVDWRGREHLLAIARQAMGRILVDHARHDRRAKHGGEWKRLHLEDIAATIQCDASPVRVEGIAIDAALTRLASIHPREAKVVVLHFFFGLSKKEIAEHLGVAVRSVARDWVKARTWLQRELESRDSETKAA